MGYQLRKVYHGYTTEYFSEIYTSLREAKNAAEEWARASSHNTAYLNHNGKTIKYQIQQQLVISED